MARDYASIDISNGNVPGLAELADEVHRTNRPRVLKRADEDLAVVMPLAPTTKRPSKRSPTPDDIQAAWDAFGTWQGEDVETFLRHNEESRRRSTRPPVRL